MAIFMLRDTYIYIHIHTYTYIYIHILARLLVGTFVGPSCFNLTLDTLVGRGLLISFRGLWAFIRYFWAFIRYLWAFISYFWACIYPIYIHIQHIQHIHLPFGAINKLHMLAFFTQADKPALRARSLSSRSSNKQPSSSSPCV